ncbi:MAG: hypothetical protein K9J13_00205 [Saprospiraceae bacterium]|nr:hypothetical protein [Saprospiraceae bacterium]
MRRFLVLVTLLSIFAFNGIIAKEMVIRGNYYGYNLYVINPSVGDEFCVEEVKVNNIVSKDEIKSNSFEIDFSLLDIKVGDKVVIKIKYSKSCTPKIVNPEDLEPPDFFKFTTIKVKDDNLIFRIRGKPGDEPFYVQQYKWNKWYDLGEVDVMDTIKLNLYSKEIVPHSGQNTFRVKKINKRGEIIYSKQTHFRDNRINEVTMEKTKVHDELVFSEETEYEIYDEEGKLIKKGKDRYIDFSSFPKGKYWVNYDCKTELITKK